ncbi:DNA methyltransferase [Phenylobacterium sp.]|uniref:DNA methyltransferase n=1 Tax=Phenylobacterium sp. TaxID=1871053 RepID=UPI002639C56A|nr:DNA methyltransferase [Phenylobacterium sp.]
MTRSASSGFTAIVFDPFLGSGTTIIAAERTGRRGYGLEFDTAYVDVILRRYEAETGGPAVLAATGQTFAERERTLALPSPMLALPAPSHDSEVGHD